MPRISETCPCLLLAWDNVLEYNVLSLLLRPSADETLRPHLPRLGQSLSEAQEFKEKIKDYLGRLDEQATWL